MGRVLTKSLHLSPMKPFSNSDSNTTECRRNQGAEQWLRSQSNLLYYSDYSADSFPLSLLWALFLGLRVEHLLRRSGTVSCNILQMESYIIPHQCSISPFCCKKNISSQSVPAEKLHFTSKSFYLEWVVKRTGVTGWNLAACKRGKKLEDEK